MVPPLIRNLVFSGIIFTKHSYRTISQVDVDALAVLKEEAEGMN